MGHKKGCAYRHKQKTKPSKVQEPSAGHYDQGAFKKLEIVLKCDSAGSVEAVRRSLAGISTPQVIIEIIHAGVGTVNKSDIFMAETGSRLVVGFNTEVIPKVDDLLRQHNVEVRLYKIIYKLIEDVRAIAKSLITSETQEQILGTAKVMALFKSSRKGIILGCEVTKGYLSVGQRFRVISAMGPVYVGRIGSLHIQKDVVQKATIGQQVGLKIEDFNKAKVGYLVESYRPQKQTGPKSWEPRGKVLTI